MISNSEWKGMFLEGKICDLLGCEVKMIMHFIWKLIYLYGRQGISQMQNRAAKSDVPQKEYFLTETLAELLTTPIAIQFLPTVRTRVTLALSYKSEGSGFYFRCGHSIF
jgi:hypothetical protein